MTARTSLFPKLSQLRGRLHLMLGELEHRSEKEDATTTELPATALLVYREGNAFFLYFYYYIFSFCF